MINDVLDLSRIDSGNLRLETSHARSRRAGRGDDGAGHERRRRAAASASASALAPGTSAVLGDATRVKQILTNLLSNAVKYNIDNGRVHIASRLATPDVIEISVTDTGLGMTPEQMEELFRPFNRLGRERTALQGTGIGLVISRRLAELMGGSIRVKSVPSEGSSFILRLPKAIDPDTVRSRLDDFESLPADYHRRIVHYIEDNETNVEVMRGILAQRAQVQMEVSLTGLDGLAAVRARQPHLILLDMHLPDVGGNRAARPPQGRAGDGGDPGDRRLRRRHRPAGRRRPGRRRDPLPDQAGGGERAAGNDRRPARPDGHRLQLNRRAGVRFAGSAIADAASSPLARLLALSDPEC